MNSCFPFLQYWFTFSAVRPQTTMLCHSVLSTQFPSLSFIFSVVANRSEATLVPPCVVRSSGS